MVKRKPKRAWWNITGHFIAMLRDRAGRIQLGLYAGFGLILLGIYGLAITPPDVTPEQHRLGWDAELAAKTGPAIAASQPVFAIRDENGGIVSSKGSYADLWRYQKVANNGKFLLLPPQQTGDCASFACAHAFLNKHSEQIVEGKTGEKLQATCPMELYAVGRVHIGKRCFGPDPGCTVGMILQGAQGYGLVSWEKAEAMGFPYSGQQADNWGWYGLPKEMLTEARKVRLRTFSAIQSWEDLVDAIANGYPVPFGAQMVFRRDTVEQDGKRWLQFDASVPPKKRGHAQCLLGIEDRPGKQPGAFCMGSWGVNAHDKPLNGEPPGGGWVSKDLVERFILTGHDCYAVSDTDSFEVKREVQLDPEWNAFSPQVIDQKEVAQELAAIDQPESQSVVKETSQMYLPYVSAGMVCCGVLLFFLCLYLKYGRRHKLGTTALILLTIAGLATTADAGHRRKLARQQAAAQSSQCICPPGACAAGQCAAYGCTNCQAATAAKPAEAGNPAVQYQWKCDGTRCRLVPVPAAESKPAADPPKKATAGGEHLFRDNGDGTWTDAAEAKFEDERIANEPKSDPPPPRTPAASVEAFNAFGPTVVESKPENAWTAWPMERTLRSYADCYEHETDFILVIGSETDALMTLETADKPVAHELSHHAIEPGAYRIHLENGQMVKEVLGKSEAMTVSSVRVRRQR